jgi:chromosome segregation ATPase
MPRKAKGPPPEVEITERSTKAEILAAYQRLAQAAAENPSGEAVRGDAPARDASLFTEERPAMKAETRKEVEALSLDAIVMELSSLKLAIGKHLTDVEERLSAEAVRLAALKEAAAEQEARLRELHEIEAAAGQLEELRQTIASEKETFEAVMAETRAQWDKEKREHEAALKERDALDKKERQREEEDYQYQLKQRRQREKDAFEAEREERRRKLEEELAAREADVKAREEAVAAQEKELAELRQRVQAFPAQLDEAVRAAAESAAKATEERLKLEKLLLEKDMEREREVMRLTVASLQERVKEQEGRIKALDADLKESVVRSQSVAARAIEGIAGLRHAEAVQAETAKEPGSEPRR